MNILHIATDEKFIDQAFDVFERVFPKENDFIIFSKSENLKFVKHKVHKIVKYRLSQIRAPKLGKEEYKGYDLVIFHSFGDVLYPEIFNIPNDVPTVWLGWGYDYYDLIDEPNNLLLPETKKIASNNYRTLLRAMIRKVLLSIFDIIGISKSRKIAIEKLSFFSPVLPNEYDLVFYSQHWEHFPEHVSWNYGTMEDHLIKGFEGEEVNGKAILIGNSSSQTCNHKEVLDFLSESAIKDRKIIAPLSYGDKVYGEIITDLGEKYFGTQFNPLKDFIPIQEYVAIIKQCGYVIMNHKRQQAVGNIVIMLYLGARVFLREECPTFGFLKDLGVVISSVQELEQDISLINKPLSSNEKALNKRVISAYWSRDSAIVRTKAMVERAFESSTVVRGSK